MLSRVACSPRKMPPNRELGGKHKTKQYSIKDSEHNECHDWDDDGCYDDDKEKTDLGNHSNVTQDMVT